MPAIFRSPSRMYLHLSIQKMSIAIIAAFSGAVYVVHGQEVSPQEIVPMERFVPVGSAIFLHVSKPAEFDFALQSIGANHFSGYLLQEPRDRKVMLRNLFADLLTPKDAAQADEMIRSEVGLLIPTWRGPSHIAWMIRAPNQEAIDRWFPKESRKDSDLGAGGTLMRTGDGLIVGTRDNILVIARKSTDGRLFRAVLRLMGNKDSSSLEQDPAFRKLEPYLPSKHVARGFWSAPTRENKPPAFVERLIAGIYFTEGRLEVALRADTATNKGLSRFKDSMVERMLALPASSSVATATAFPITAADGIAQLAPLFLGEWVGTFNRSLREALPGAAEGEWPHVGFVLDKEASAGLPAIAAFIETKDAPKICEQIASAFAAPGASDQPDTGAPRVHVDRHAEHTVWHLPLCNPQDSSDERLECVLRLAPSWTHLGDWLVIGSTRKHIDQIIDADAGLAVRLSSLSEARALRLRRPNQGGFMVIQPGMLADLFEYWLSEDLAGRDSFASLSWGFAQDMSRRDDPGRLGIGAHAVTRPGTVVVARIDRESPASGKLKVGDRIVGTDGQLLNMEAPNDDLRNRWDRLLQGESLMVRAQRQDAMLEVTLTKPGPEADDEVVSLPLDAATALQTMAAFFRGIAVVTASLPITDEKHIALFVSIKPAASSPTASGK